MKEDLQTGQGFDERMTAYMMTDYFRKENDIADFYDRIKDKRELSITLYKRSGAQLPYNIRYDNDQKAIIEVAVAGYLMKDIRVQTSADFISVYTAYASSSVNQSNEVKEFLHYNRAGFNRTSEAHEQEFYVYKGITDKEFMMDFFIPRNHVEPHFLWDDGILRITFNLNEKIEQSKTYILTPTSAYLEGEEREDSKDSEEPPLRKRLVNRGPKNRGSSKIIY